MRSAMWLLGAAVGIIFAVCATAEEPLTGLLHADERANPGYTLLAPISSTSTYLVDVAGKVVHRWESDAGAGNAAYLLENGNLLRTESVAPTGRRTFDRGGAGGRVREIAPDGTVVWEFVLSDEFGRLHHDVDVLPNGNVLMIAWEIRSAEEAIAAGRDPEMLRDGELWPDRILEVQPTPPSGGRVVWEWRVWDHVIQDHDPTKENYGDVSAHPERIDLNFASAGGPADWNHTNSVAYNSRLDQIVLSVHEFSEIWVIDHSTTMGEAAGHDGGRFGRGGDLLYRWGNPQAYRAGTQSDQILYGQHDAQWIDEDLPGAGNLLLFNNGFHRPGDPWSAAAEITPPVTEDGTYVIQNGRTYGPKLPTWQYASADIYSPNISGAQRLPNGNTLICSGAGGCLTEVTQDGTVVWLYVNPFAVRQGGTLHREVFKVRRYERDHPGILMLLDG